MHLQVLRCAWAQEEGEVGGGIGGGGGGGGVDEGEVGSDKGFVLEESLVEVAAAAAAAAVVIVHHELSARLTSCNAAYCCMWLQP